MAEVDTSRAPLGVLAAQRLVAAAAEHGDLAERHYLELKSTLDLSGKKDKEKIAKFILGAANRMPDVAVNAFEGYAAMVIGVSKGAITGIRPVEVMDIAKVVQQYVGAAGPRWDVTWVPIDDSTNQVLVVIVDPPRLGQGPFPCRSNGETLTDGRIYIRADGETREANSDEVDLLVKRGSALPKPVVDFAVELVGDVFPVNLDSDLVVEEYLGIQRRRLIAALPAEEPPSRSSVGGASGALSFASNASGLRAAASSIYEAMYTAEDRTEDEYRESIDRWEEWFRTAWDAAAPRIAASQLAPVVVRVTNRTTTFFHDVELKLHLEGDVMASDYVDAEWVDDFTDLELPHPPRPWGPRERTPGFTNYAHLRHAVPYSPGTFVPPSVSYRNGGSVDLNLNVGELRPRGTYESEGDEIVLVVEKALTSIHGTWQLTARDHNDVYTGQIDVPVGDARDGTAVARQILQVD